MTYDLFTFFNELDLLEIRLNTLSDVVDRFVVAEATRTFRGRPKELFFEKNRERFSRFADRMIHVTADNLMPEDEVAKDPLALPWINENRQRNALIRGLSGMSGADVIMVSDVDEIPRPESVRRAVSLAGEGKVVRLEQDVYTCYLNFRDYRFPRWRLGTQAVSWNTFNSSARFDAVKFDRYTVESENRGRTVQKLRFLRPDLTLRRAGWHMTYMGGAEAIRTKLDSFSHAEASVAGASVESRLARGVNVLSGRRDAFGVELDGGFPPYVLANRDRFSHLIFPVTQDYLRKTRAGRAAAFLRGAAYRAAAGLVPRCLERPLLALRRRILFSGGPE